MNHHGACTKAEEASLSLKRFLRDSLWDTILFWLATSYLWLWKWTCPVSFSECGHSLSIWKRAVSGVLIAIWKPCFRAPAGWKFLNGMGAAVDSGSNCCPVLLIRAGGRERALLGYSLTAPLMNNLPEGAAHSSVWAWWNYPHPCRLISKKCIWHLVGKKTLCHWD